MVNYSVLCTPWGGCLDLHYFHTTSLYSSRPASLQCREQLLREWACPLCPSQVAFPHFAITRAAPARELLRAGRPKGWAGMAMWTRCCCRCCPGSMQHCPHGQGSAEALWASSCCSHLFAWGGTCFTMWVKWHFINSHPEFSNDFWSHLLLR